MVKRYFEQRTTKKYATDANFAKVSNYLFIIVSSDQKHTRRFAFDSINNTAKQTKAGLLGYKKPTINS